MVEHLPQALSSLNVVMVLGKNLLELRDFAKSQNTIIDFNKAIIDTQSQIMAAQKAQLSLEQKVRELEQECVRLKDWATEREKYTRKEIAPGVFAYVEKSFMGKLESAHKLCCNCFDNHQKSTLQQFSIREGAKTGLSCHRKCPDLVFQWYTEVA